jgi:hypothetical protein
MKQTENLNNKNMEPDILKEETEVPNLQDECGDTMWDAVLQQEIKACAVKDISKNTAGLLNSINTVQVCDATEA